MEGLDPSSFSANKVHMSDYIFLETIGVGSYGRVRLCRNKKTNKVFAVKMLKKSEIIRMKQVDHVFSEYTILASIFHPFIVELKGVNFTDPSYLYFILEYIPGGEMFTLLRDKNSFPANQAKFYAAHIVTIFDYLHSKNIIYRDLKPENILIQPSGFLKLTDFGFAKYITGQTYTLCGTPEYLAPEIIANKGHGKPVDWWTLGILLYEMMVGIDPFNDPDPMMVYQKIIKGKIKFPKNIDKDGKSLIKHLLVGDVSKRYGCLKRGVKDIIQHKFFENFDWNGLLFRTMRPPYVPKVKNNEDTANYNEYPDSNSEVPVLKQDKDPFINW